MMFPLRRATAAFIVAVLLPATSFAADGSAMQARAAERAAARIAQSAVERRIPTEPQQTAKTPSLTSKTAVPRMVRYHRTDERPSRREIREGALRQGSSSSRPSSSGRSTSSRSSVTSSSRSSLTSSAYRSEVEAQRQEVLRLVNEERAKEGLKPLTYNLKLQSAAQFHVQDMFDRDYFAHESPEGGTFDERIEAAGYPGACPYAGCRARIAVGENLAKGFRTPEAVLKGWMDSPGHKANILNPLFKELGVGIVGTFWSQEFGGVEYLH